MERDRGFTDEDMAEVSDNPECTEDELARAKPFAEAFPDLAQSLAKGMQIVRVTGTKSLSISLSDDVAAYYESFGEAAEVHLNADLRKLSGLA